MAVPGAGKLTLLDRVQLLSLPVALTLVGLFLSSILLLALSEFSVRATRRDGLEMAQALQRLETSAAVKGLMLEAENGQRGYMLTLDTRYLEPFESAVTLIGPAFDRLRGFSPSPDLRNRVDEMEATASERLQVARLTISLLQADAQEDAIDVLRGGRGKALMDRFREQLASFDAVAQQEVATLRGRQSRAGLWPRLAALTSSLLAFGLLLTVGRLLIRSARDRQLEAEEAALEAQRMQRLVDARTAELSDLSSHLQTVSEREKAELARNLHDELGGLLTAARMDLSWLQGATKGLDPEIGEKLQQLNMALQEAMDVKRRVVESLRPALLDHFGLPTALQNYFDETCKKAGIACTTTIPEDMADIPQDLAIALFRVGQESLTNIVRHARARNVHMAVDDVDNAIRVTVVDDGVGVDLTGRQFRGSHGINGMRHRVRGLGGTFDIQSAPGAGTRIRISVPRERPPEPVPFADAAP